MSSNYFPENYSRTAFAALIGAVGLTTPGNRQRCETVDEYVAGTEHWQEEILRLREILLATGLTGEVRKPSGW